MKSVRLILTMTLLLGMLPLVAQERTAEGMLNTTTTKTLNWNRDGVKIPYQITIQENRLYTAEFVQNQANNENFDRKQSPALVSKLITVKSDVDNSLNKIIVLRYEKQLSDSFELVATPTGFAIEVDGRKMEYIFKKGIYFANTADKDFFIIDEFESL